MSGRLITGLLAVMGLVTAAACSDPPTAGSGDAVTADDLPDCPLDALEEAEEPVDVTLWYGGIGGATEDVMRDMVERFNSSQDKVVVTSASQGESFEEVFRKYDNTAAASTSQLPELLMTEDTTLRAMADRGQVLPAQACMEADGYDIRNIEPIIRSSFSVEDVMFPGYANVSSLILYYNKSHWARAGLDPEAPPETLDELYEHAKAIKDEGISDKPLSLKLGSSFFENWLNAVGVDLVNDENGRGGSPSEATFNTPEARELLEFFVKMNNEGLLNPFSSTEGSIDHYLAVIDQQSSMLAETSTASTTIRDFLGGRISAEEAGSGFDPGQLDLSQLIPGSAEYPGVEEPGQVAPGGGVFYILNTSEPAQQAASWKFLEFMLQPENGKIWHLQGGYLPIVKEVQEDPEVRDFWDNDLAGLMLSQAVEQMGDADPDRPGPIMGPYIDVGQSIEDAWESILFDGASVEDALAKAEEESNEALERYRGD